MNKKTVGLKLKQIRERHHMEIGEATAQIDVHAQQVLSWERGLSYPRVDKLAEYLGVYKMNLSGFFSELEGEEAGGRTNHRPSSELENAQRQLMLIAERSNEDFAFAMQMLARLVNHPKQRKRHSS